MSLLTLVRHGQASYMSMDYDRLSEMGERQAAKLGQFWARHRLTFDTVVCGPAKRHLRTMEIAGDEVRKAGLPWPEPVVRTEFDEFDAFTMMRLMLPMLVREDEQVRALNEDFERNRHTPEAGRKLQKLFEAAARHWAVNGVSLDNVESWPQFRSRIAGALNQIRATAPRSSSTLVFTSGGPIAASVAHVLELTDAKAIEFVWLSRNGSYAQFLFSDDRFSMHSFNSVPHYDDLQLHTYR
jgi:broad specificity phosphatase PhoE